MFRSSDRGAQLCKLTINHDLHWSRTSDEVKWDKRDQVGSAEYPLHDGVINEGIRREGGLKESRNECGSQEGKRYVRSRCGGLGKLVVGG